MKRRTRLLLLALGLSALIACGGTFAALSWLADDPARAMFARADAAHEATPEQPLPPVVSYTELLRLLDSGQVAAVVLRERELALQTRGGAYAMALIPANSAGELAARIAAAGAEVKVVPPPSGEWRKFGLSLVPALILLIPLVWLLRGQMGRSGMFGIGRSPATLIDPAKNALGFADVAGVEEAKDELAEIVSFLKEPLRFQRLGGRIPKGALLVGPPGTGKTLLARAVAGEAGVPFFSISGSDFVEMFVGVGARRVRAMFREARKRAPCILFVDEIDAVGRRRNAGNGSGGHDEHDQTLNQLLVEMDGFDAQAGIIVLAATNRADVLDPALLRPGRFDRQVHVGAPDLKGRERILALHAGKLQMAEDVDLRAVARGTPGFTGADLANLANEAALIAARRKAGLVDMAAFEAARDKILMGGERRTLTMSDEERRLTAFHEAGHALVALNCPDSDPVHKATIAPRGRSLGAVVRLPERDRVSLSRAKLEADLAVAMGGRVAEELVFGRDRVTTGAAADIEMATHLARSMVCDWGMSDTLGPLAYGETDGRYAKALMSDSTTAAVNAEIRALVEGGAARARALLERERAGLEAVAAALLDRETLSADEIRDALAGTVTVASRM